MIKTVTRCYYEIFVLQFFISILREQFLRFCIYALVFISSDLENIFFKISKKLPDL